MTLAPGQSITQSGRIEGTTSAPEPGSLTLLGARLCLLAGKARRKILPRV